MTALAIASNTVRLMLRDRANLFFVFVFPLVLILLLGATFGGDVTYELAVAGPTEGRFSGAVLDELGATDRIEVVLTDAGTARDRVARGRSAAALLLPDGFDDVLASGGASTEAAYIAGNNGAGQLLRAPVDAALGRVRAVATAATIASDHAGVDRERALRRAGLLRGAVPGPSVTLTTVGQAGGEALAEYAEAGPFALVTHQELLLFTFLTSLTTASSLIESRRLGVSRRMLAAPTTVDRILLGHTLGRFSVALVQAVYLIVGTGVLFGVDWGGVTGWLPLVALFALVSSAAGLVMGSVFRNDTQMAGLGVFVGLTLAAIGGCMLPLELFSPTMRTVAHVTPHAWALDGFRDLVQGGGGLADLGGELAALAAFAVALLTVGTLTLRRSLLRSV